MSTVKKLSIPAYDAIDLPTVELTETEAKVLDIDKGKIARLLKLHENIDLIKEEINRFVVRDSKSCIELGRLFTAARTLKFSSFGDWVEQNTSVSRQYAYNHIWAFDMFGGEKYHHLIEKIEKTGLLMLGGAYNTVQGKKSKGAWYKEEADKASKAFDELVAEVKLNMERNGGKIPTKIVKVLVEVFREKIKVKRNNNKNHRLPGVSVKDYQEWFFNMDKLINHPIVETISMEYLRRIDANDRTGMMWFGGDAFAKLANAYTKFSAWKDEQKKQTVTTKKPSTTKSVRVKG